MRDDSDARPLNVVVLAAEESGQMRSSRPKPLHRLCGRPMVRYVLDAVESLSPNRVVVVVGNGAERVTRAVAGTKPVTDIVEQIRHSGNAAGVLAGLSVLDDDFDTDADIVIIPADVPLVGPADLTVLVDVHRSSGAAATVMAADGRDLGGLENHSRVVRGGRDESIQRVTDAADLVGDERLITEVATGIWCVRQSILAAALRRAQPDHTGEVAISGIIEVLAATGHAVHASHSANSADVVGINDRVELADAEAELRRRTNRAWLERGVTMLDPARTYIDATVELAPDVTLYPGVILQGDTVVGEGSEIGPDTRLIDTRVGPGCRVEKTMAEHSVIGPDCHVGPFAVLGEGCELTGATVTGPFYAPSAGGQ
jgi:bifunctional UDP-N-acetylglucosamine pyrophosphorylase/glucosamine-1-phosphate N-acetyltransferase